MFQVYGKPNCPDCLVAKGILESRNIFYEYYDVSTNQEALAFIKALGVRSVPVVFEEDKMIGGLSSLRDHFVFIE